MKTRFRPPARNQSTPKAMSPAMTQQSRIAFWAIVIIATIILISVLITIFNNITQGNSLAPNVYVTLVGIGLLYVSAGLIYRGRLIAGLISTTIIIDSALLFRLSLLSGNSIALAITLSFIVPIVLTSVIIPHRLATAIIANFTITCGIILFDLYTPWWRNPPQDFETQNIFISLTILIIISAVTLLNQFRLFPLNAKILLILLTFTIVPIIILGYSNNANIATTLNKNTDDSLQSAAKQVASSLDEFITTHLNDLANEAQLAPIATFMSNYASEGPRVSANIQQEANDMLRALVRKDTLNIASYALLDPKGNVLLDTAIENIGKNQATRSFFQRAINSNAPATTPVEFEPITNDPFIYFSAPVRNPSDQIVGILRVKYHAYILQNIVTHDNNLASPGSFAILLDENHVRLAHGTAQTLLYHSVMPFSESRTAGLIAAQRLPNRDKALLATNINEFEQGLVNIERAAIFTTPLQSLNNNLAKGAVVRTKSQPWFVVYFLDNDVYLRPIAEQTRTTTIIALVLSLIVVFSSIFIAQILANPIVRLTGVAAQIQAGDLTVQAAVESSDEIGALAIAFNGMTSRLRDLVASLEERVADRTRALEASAQVSRKLSTILDEKNLVTAIVEEVQTAFNYYHAHIYLYDEAQENLIMAGGTGEVGQMLLAQGHRLGKGKGLVGRAAADGSPVLVADVTQDPQWVPNSLLPDTKAEVAVPIIVGNKVLGVLDVQHNVTNGLQTEDVALLQAIANQVGIALQNARSYQGVQRQAELDARITTITQKMQGASSIEDVLQIAARELGNTLGARRAKAQIGKTINPETVKPL